MTTKKQTRSAILIAICMCMSPMFLVGCGKKEATMIKPEMTAEEIQAKADAKNDEDDEAAAT